MKIVVMYINQDIVMIKQMNMPSAKYKENLSKGGKE